MNSSQAKTLAVLNNNELNQNHSPESRGFALLACILLVILLSAISIGLLMMVTSEGKAGGYNAQNTIAYHATEGAIEKMTTDLANSFTNVQAPQPSDIINLKNLVPPDTASVKYLEYSFTPQVDPLTGNIAANYHLISSGPNQGLYAQVMPIQLKATTQTGLNAQVSMIRNVEVALIPVFQFGVFSDSDLGFYSSPNLAFNGRIHTNQDLYLGVANNFNVKFNDKITAYGNVIRQVLPNGLPSASNNNSGTVSILNAPNGCNGAAPACVAMGLNQGSVVGGPASAQNPAWPNISKGTYAGWILDGNYGQPGGTGAVKLVLPFTNPGPAAAVAAGTAPKPYEIIRRPVATDSPATSQARLYNQAEIRVLLSDDPAELPGGPSDPQNIRLANVQNATGPDYRSGVPATTPAGLPNLPGNANYTTYFAEASTAVQDPTNWNSRSTTSLPPDWPTPPAAPPAGHATLTPAGAPITATGATTTWNLIDGYLRVEYRDAAGNYNPITKEWLELGFARGTLPPSGGPSSNPVNPNAILIFQQPADRNADGVVDQVGAPHATCNNGVACINRPPETPKDTVTNRFEFGSSNQANSVTRNNWYPINFYDAREGEARDQDAAVSASCTVNGIMNAVELDVANLKRWLADNAGSGPSVVFNKDNGYILYFSDRRGMHPNAAGVKLGDSGLEDVVNAASVNGVPDQVLEPAPPVTPGHTALSPEDVNQNGILDNYGAWNLGAGFNVNTGTTAGSLTPYGTARIPDCFKNAGFATPPGRKNWVSGARHVIRLVNGSLGDVPTQPSGIGGFTVASENPVYVLGNYNTNSTDPAWNGANFGTNQAPHAAAGIIADAVTLLSNNWSDNVSLLHPTGATGNRPGATTYYRVAIAAGKNITFPNPPYATGVMYGFGTDGGVHNFLRFLEDWSGQTLHYAGSMVSLYYSTYATGTFKCCNDAVYHPPTRDYQFDIDFQDPAKLPPGTPMFRDINNLSFRQDFTPSTLAPPNNQF